MRTPQTITDLLRLKFGGLGSFPTPEEVLTWFNLLQAGWVHNGDPKKPHAVLHSGLHSTGFFLCKRVLAYGNLREILAECIVNKLYTAGGESFMKSIGGVFGSPYSSILLAGDIARLMEVKVYVPEKDPADPDGKKMRFKPDDPIPAGTILLQIEELVTKFDSGDATKQAIIDGNSNPVEFAKFVGVLVYRPPEIAPELPDGRTIIPFIQKRVDAWDPKYCPLCSKGSKVVSPKTNWAELTA
ncbi:MAG: hypothetical protein NTW11_02330 [Candidatus Staskawiczbacteria bacterium]|nr:hypothetical protein [Candidatus Staskawiczbacteria bacterium]